MRPAENKPRQHLTAYIRKTHPTHIFKMADSTSQADASPGMKALEARVAALETLVATQVSAVHHGYSSTYRLSPTTVALLLLLLFLFI